MSSIGARSPAAWWVLLRSGILAVVAILSGAAAVSGAIAIGPVAVGLGGSLLLATLVVLLHRNRLLRASLTEVRGRFDDAFESMAEGLALFDADERLVCCNRRYTDCFPRTAWMRVPGARIADLRAAAVKFGEFRESMRAMPPPGPRPSSRSSAMVGAPSMSLRMVATW